MIKRTRLLTQIATSTSQLWLIEAGAGFGKTALIDDLSAALVEPIVTVRAPLHENDLQSFVTELAEASRRSASGDTAEAFAGSGQSARALAGALVQSGYALVIDDVHLWSDQVSAFILDLVIAVARRSRIFVVGRSMPAPLATLGFDGSAQFLGASDLAFTPTETVEVLTSRGLDARDVATVLFDASHGWPLAVASAAARMTRTADPMGLAQSLARHEVLIDGLLRSYLDGLDPGDVETARALAVLPYFDDGCAELLGSPGVIDRLIEAGVPITRRRDSWAEMAEHLRSSLSRTGANRPKLSPEVAAHFVARGEIQAALNLCLGLGQHDTAADIVAGITLTQQSWLDPATLNAAMTTIGDAVAVAPRCLLVQAQVNATFGQVAEGLACLERCVVLFDAADPHLVEPNHLEALLELGVWRVMQGDSAAATELLDLCEPLIGEGGRSLQARVHDLKGLLLHLAGRTEDLERAAIEMSHALAIWRQLGEPRAAAVTVFRLAGGVLASLGRRGEALLVLDNLPSVGAMTMLNRARLGVERAILLPYLGRAAEVAEVAAAARHTAETLGHDWLVGWTLWTEIIAASFDDDADRVVALLAAFDEGEYFIVNDYTQAMMWCETAVALARCARFAEARVVLARAQAIDTRPEWSFQLAQASLDARDGDASAALRRLDSLAEAPEVDLAERWSIDLLQAVCHRRLGDTKKSAELLAQSFGKAEEIEQGSLPNIVERRLVEELSTKGAWPTAAESEHIIEITLFDGFEMFVDGERIDVPRGHPATVVKILVLGGGRLVLDQIIDRLWPTADASLGRRRLRNVLTRLREGCGDIATRDGETLQMASHVSSDYSRAQAAVSEALLPDASLAMVNRALDFNLAVLLPDDRYDEWAEDARRAQAASVLRLLDTRARLAEQQADIHLAVHALEQAAELDPFDHRRISKAAALLRADGRDAAAESLERRYDRTGS